MSEDVKKEEVVEVSEVSSDEQSDELTALLREKARWEEKHRALLGEKRQEKDRRQALEAEVADLRQSFEQREASHKRLLEALGVSVEQDDPQAQLKKLEEDRRVAEVSELRREIERAKIRERVLMNLPSGPDIDREYLLWKAERTNAFGEIVVENGRVLGAEKVVEELQGSGMLQTAPIATKQPGPETGQPRLGEKDRSWKKATTKKEFWLLPVDVIKEAQAKDPGFLASLKE